jgi:hypothetical protein
MFKRNMLPSLNKEFNIIIINNIIILRLRCKNQQPHVYHIYCYQTNPTLSLIKLCYNIVAIKGRRIRARLVLCENPSRTMISPEGRASMRCTQLFLCH